jgi:hypothetical protein
MGFPKLGSIFGELHLDGCVPFVNAGDLWHPINLHRRPSSRSVAALNVGIAASSFVPVAVLDGGAADFWLGRGEREGPDCFVHLSARFSPYIFGDSCFILLFFWGPL